MTKIERVFIFSTVVLIIIVNTNFLATCSNRNMELKPRKERLIEPDFASDMTSWDFSYKRECEPFTVNQLTSIRYKYSLNCDVNVPTEVISVTDNSQDIFNISFGDICVLNFIENRCKDINPVPNIVHYVWFGNRQLGFFNFLSLLSVLRFMKPCLILLHGPDLPHGPYWDHFLSLSPNIVHVHREVPKDISGNTLMYKQHSSDVMRIETLIEYGGVYMDFDEILLRPIDSLRRFTYTQGKETSSRMGSQLIMASRNATFLHMWYQSYKDDYRSTWVYNALEVPDKIATTYPELIHIEGFRFSTPFQREIFYSNYNWASNYGMHMFERSYKRAIDPHYIRTLNTTLGSTARHILFGNKELCEA